MRKCPCCGFEPTPTNRQLLNIYRREFGAWPVMAMIERQWLKADRADIEAVRKELFQFFGVASMQELNELLDRGLTLPPKEPPQGDYNADPQKKAGEHPTLPGV